MRQLPSMDITDPEVAKSAKQADIHTGISGEYIAKIVRASLRETANGAVFIDLHFEMPNGKIYKQDSRQILKSDGSEGFYVPKMRTIFGITGAKDTIGTMKVMNGDFTDDGYVEREVEVRAYTGLIGKEIGIVLNFYQAYPESFGMNGYNSKPIPTKAEDEASYNEAKKMPTTIWMPDYTKEPQPIFDFVLFFDPVTRKTFSEITDDTCTEPKRVDEELVKLAKKNHSAVKLNVDAWDKVRIRKLKANLKKAGMKYDKSLFISKSPGSMTNVEDDNSDIV